MHEILKDKSVIFFDIGNTLDYPASGDWMFTKKFIELAGEKRLMSLAPEQLNQAYMAGVDYLLKNHRLRDEAEEEAQFTRFYGIISESLGLGLTEEELQSAARDRTYNMDNYLLYPDARTVLERLSLTHRIGVISDTWPSVENQLRSLDIRQFISYETYSFAVGAFKPDPSMFRDALAQAGCPAEKTVFIDDSPRNLEGAAALGITPILIAADPGFDPEVPFLKIHALSELL